MCRTFRGLVILQSSLSHEMLWSPQSKVPTEETLKEIGGERRAKQALSSPKEMVSTSRKGSICFVVLFHPVWSARVFFFFVSQSVNEGHLQRGTGTVEASSFHSKLQQVCFERKWSHHFINANMPCVTADSKSNNITDWLLVLANRGWNNVFLLCSTWCFRIQLVTCCMQFLLRLITRGFC